MAMAWLLGTAEAGRPLAADGTLFCPSDTIRELDTPLQKRFRETLAAQRANSQGTGRHPSHAQKLCAGGVLPRSFRAFQ